MRLKESFLPTPAIKPFVAIGNHFL